MREWKEGDAAPMLACGFEVSCEMGGSERLRFADNGVDCRREARGLPHGAEVLIGEGVADVAPLNLAAAIRHDRGDIRIHVAASCRDGSTASRASSAGVEMLVSPAEALERISRRGSTTSHGRTWVVDDGRRSMVACFVSGRGGVGKSSMSILFALVAADAGLKTALVDLDMQFGDLAFLCGDDDAFEKISLEDAMEGFDFARVPESRIPLLHADSLPEYADGSSHRLQRFVQDMRSFFDVVFINTGTYWVEGHADIIDASDLAVFVMDQRPASVVSCREAMGLANRLGIPSSKFVFLLNRCDAHEQINGYDCVFALGIDDIIQIFDGGKEVEDVLALGTPSLLVGSRNSAMHSIARAARDLLSRFGFPIDSISGGTGERTLRRRNGWIKRAE